MREEKSVSGRLSVFVGCAAAIAFASCGPAFARDQKPATALAAPQTPQAPWYERFTFGSELREGANAWVPRGESRTSAVVDSRNRWGVTFGVNQDPRAALAPRTGESNTRTSAGAFYQVSPQFRVGGAVTLPDDQLGVSQRRDGRKPREPGVKIESAVRF
jgi:hypothetical protein